ncbi:MAG: hypothetical protein J1F64_02295, partial [Oscillospiraceae bacterium]|nr:hypothetical protein [Oscillospiraceae bacterium]
ACGKICQKDDDWRILNRLLLIHQLNLEELCEEMKVKEVLVKFFEENRRKTWRLPGADADRRNLCRRICLLLFR